MRTGMRRGGRWIPLVAATSIVVGSGFAYANSESSTPQRWTVAPQVMPGQLNGVSCLGPNRCIAVGAKSTPGPLVEMGNGDNWTVTSAPSAGRTTLNAVSCISMKHCFAVGRQTPVHPAAIQT